MINAIFDKTDKGREEIATRCHRLAPRLRTLLVLIDGKHDIADLLKKVAGLGLDEHSIAELLEAGFVQESAPSMAKAPPSPVAAEAVPAPVATATAENPVLPAGENQFEAIYHFYNETIKSTIGLRGYALQLKVERAESVEDFRALRRPYLEAVLKAKGNEMARSLRDRLDQLLYLGETAPPHTTILGSDAHSG
ncbi:MAG TPA: hypothetical protein VL051_15430 [Burkholderiaceae bacterium]|nr:hypothetical protein [Burkholderiaceae bacterium]